MANITKISHANNISSSKAAEIHREDSGRIFYVCFHCGTNLDSIADTLAHIDIHFSTQINIKTDDEPLEFIDIKYEIFEDTSQEVDPTHLEQIFIDCNTKPNLINEEECFRMETCDNIPGQQTLSITSENLTDMERLFEWKCLYCWTVLKKFEKLKLHLMKHVNDPVPTVPLETTTYDKKSIKAQYSFKCTLCSSEFYDSSSSEQHLKDFHNGRPPIKYGQKFVSPEERDTVKIAAPAKKNRQKFFHVEGIDNPSLCIFCGKTFKGARQQGTLDLLQHIFGHFNLQIFTCPECPVKYQRVNSIHDHMKKKHSLTLNQKFECRICKLDNSFTLLELVVHSFTYHLDEGDKKNDDLDGSFSYDCRFCFKNFTEWFEASTHLKIHAEDRLPEECLPGLIPIRNTRCLTERAKRGMHRNEFLYNCSACTQTLCGSFEARKHQITVHERTTENRVHNPSTDKLDLKCYECDTEVESQYYLKKHILMHFNVSPYTCTVCPKTFSFSSNAVRHISKTHLIKSNDSTRLLNCRYCKAEFTKDSNFISHMFNDHLYVNFNINENLDGRCKYECIYCKEIFMERDLIRKHLWIHKSEALPKKDPETVSLESINALRHVVKFLFCCLYCTKKYRLPHSISEHVKNTHKVENKDNAKKCEQLATGDINYNRKLPLVKDKPECENRPEECEQLRTEETDCKTELQHVMDEQKIENQPMEDEQLTTWDTNSKTQFQHVKDEQSIERKPKPKKVEQPKIRDTNCDLCNAEFPTWRSMVNHRAKGHPETVNTDVKHKSKNAGRKKGKQTTDTHCSLCNFTFSSVRSMINHRSQRHPELLAKDRYKNRPSYTCPTCGKIFRERSNFNHHTETHAQIHWYSCDYCHKTYRLKNSLQTHMLSHMNQKNFVCEQCGKSFYTVSKLNLHNQVHENLTFECGTCQKVFYTRNNFSKHKKTHTDNVRKKCFVCDNTFKSQVSLRVHMLLHSDEKKYSCRFCDMSFAQSSGRRGHERLKHGF